MNFFAGIDSNEVEKKETASRQKNVIVRIFLSVFFNGGVFLLFKFLQNLNWPCFFRPVREDA